jgi:autoinducer 2-degrading protein
MIVTCVHVFVKEENREDFIEAIIKNHEGTIKEPGNIRFDVLQNAEDPSKFLIYEVFESEEAVAAHKKTAHYLEWRETVENWMAQSRQGIRYTVISPTDIDQW